ncbi:ferritin-like domain-containing protein [Hymenobacter sp. ASUV-10]|uniref:Ferritin-like domain-containing protein n=1 Tax=Hymenobacter aranciens TaxID=3063996 RepID=A0ABT9B8X9_9BACT|nr:ferritin-like domain-containing protein [Hymenobacter sp. ASUV-10]MDO7874637.1 ferritin-like domain-containing protein [Hymenobacter sp. ASUV-10]
MNFFEIIKQLAEVDSDVLGRLDSRRAVFSSLGTAAKRGAMAATPALLGAFFQKAYAGTSGTKVGTIAEIFKYALTLEQLEADFYKKMVDSSVFGSQSAAAQAAIRQIKKHEDAHVALLSAVLTGLGSPSTTTTTFKASAFPADWTGQLQVAQLLEDTGVRAYKGRAGDILAAGGAADANVTGVGTVNPLQAALQIHSVEARHAAHIRYMRSQTPWITGSGDLDGQEHYKGTTPESTTTQAGIDLLTVTSGKTYTTAEAAASFDEILTPAEVLDPVRAGALVG